MSKKDYLDTIVDKVNENLVSLNKDDIKKVIECYLKMKKKGEIRWSLM